MDRLPFHATAYARSAVKVPTVKGTDEQLAINPSTNQLSCTMRTATFQHAYTIIVTNNHQINLRHPDTVRTTIGKLAPGGHLHRLLSFLVHDDSSAVSVNKMRA